MVLAAAKAARAGLPLGSVVDEARRAAGRVRLLATLPSLDYLARGGRVPGAAAWGARWLGLSPVFEFRQGKIRPLRPARGGRLARQRIVDIWAREITEERQRGAALRVTALHAAEPAVAEDLLSEVGRRLPAVHRFCGIVQPGDGGPDRPRPGRAGLVVG